MDDDSGNEIARYNYDFSGQRAKKILKDGSIVYSFDGIFEIAVPNGKPQQQTLLVKGYKGEIAGQMTDLSATLLTSADIEKEKQYAFLLPFRNTFHSFKHFVNRHIVASPAFLYAGHSSLDYILSYNSFSWKAKTGAFLILLMILYIFLYKHSGHIQKEEEYSSARFFRLTSPAVTMGFLMTFVLQSCTGLSHHSSQTPWAALGAAAINANTPAIGDVPGFGTPGEGGSSHAGSAIASGAGTPVEGMYFFHNDNIMSTKVLSNAAGEAVTGSNGASRLIYNPYGDINTDYSKGPDIVRRKYTGQELDNESGLYYYNARYYDPALGRFITADSIGNVGGPNGDNRYMYVSGNPMKFNDPDGHKETQWHKNMMKDLKAAMIDKAIDVVGLPAAALYMLQKQKDKRDYYKKTMIERNAAGWFDRQVVNPIQHMNGTELLIGAIVVVLVVLATVFLGPANPFLGAGFGILMTYAGRGVGRTLGGYSDSDWNHLKWNSEKADKGEQIGEDAASIAGSGTGFFKDGAFSSVGKLGIWAAFEVGGAITGYGLGELTEKDVRRWTDNASFKNPTGRNADRASAPEKILRKKAGYYASSHMSVNEIAIDVIKEIISNDICSNFQKDNCTK